ncbi:MAG TPA: PEGA domain-containing protein [Kofleriaceae bacterium]|nr:PEGA domain-containing protein [Kofleriaceae bacterium]
MPGYSSVALVLGLAACGASSAHPIPVAVLVDGDPAAVGKLDPVPGLALHPVALPAPPAARADETSAVLARVHAAYAKGDFDTCRNELARVDVVARLAAGERADVARALTYAAACAYGGASVSEAQAIAARFASLGLELPEAAVSPDVEAMIGKAIEAHGREPAQSFAIAGEIGARLGIDGKPAGCALPCTVTLSAGEHVLAVDADGFQPTARSVRVPDDASVKLEQTPASRELAARQWRARIGRGEPAADRVGAALITKLSGDSRVALVHGDRQLSGWLVIDGKSVAADTAARGDGRELVRELAYDGGLLHRPSVWQRPWFWIAVSAVALATTGTIYYINRPIHTTGEL